MTNGWRTVGIVLARSYLKSLARRDFRFRFSFSKSIAPPCFGKDLLAVSPTGFGESVIFSYLFWDATTQWKTGTRLWKNCRYFLVAKDNSLLNRRDTFYGNVSLWRERKTGLFKRNTATKVPHRTHQLKQQHRVQRSFVYINELLFKVSTWKMSIPVTCHD